MRDRRHAVLAVGGALLLASIAHAEWPTEPEAPLLLGEALGVTGDVAVVATPDGATWVGWIDGPCFPTFFVQRIDADGSLLVPGGLALATQDDDCIELEPRLAACADGTVVASGIGSDPLSTPVHRVAADGSLLWAPSVVAADGFLGGVQQLLGLPGGDALVAGRAGLTITVGRYAADGTRVWDPPATFSSATGTNMRIFALTTDGADGAYVLWDAPGAYTRRVFAMRVDAGGAAAWPAPLLVVDIPPGSSRHTDPIALADGTGALVLVWTEGAESGSTPVPVRTQRILPGGTMMFDMDGRRVSTAGSRQFDAQAIQRAPGGDVYVVWRDGGFGVQEVRVQRMTLAGERVWGETGVVVTTIAGSSSQLTMHALAEDALAVAVSDLPADPRAPRVRAHRIDAAGNVADTAWPVSGPVAAGSIAGASLDGAVACVWRRAPGGAVSEVVAQRLNPDGTLGGPAPRGDVDGDGVVDFTDLLAVLAAWGPCPAPCPEDVDADGVVGFADLLLLLANWSA